MRYILFLLFLALSNQSFSQDSLLIKIHKVIELSGAKASSELTLENMFETQLRLLPELDAEYIKEFHQTFKDSALERVIDEVAIIYTRHFTEEHIDELILFYRSDLGKHLVKSQPEMLKESMAAGEEIGFQVSEQTINIIQNKNETVFNKEYSGCLNLQEGEFYYESQGIRFDIERTSKTHTEHWINVKSKYKVIWISECMYKLELIKSNHPNRNPKDEAPLLINIINVDSAGYDYIMKEDGSYYKGRILIKDVK